MKTSSQGGSTVPSAWRASGHFIRAGDWRISLEPMHTMIVVAVGFGVLGLCAEQTGKGSILRTCSWPPASSSPRRPTSSCWPIRWATPNPAPRPPCSARWNYFSLGRHLPLGLIALAMLMIAVLAVWEAREFRPPRRSFPWIGVEVCYWLSLRARCAAGRSDGVRRRGDDPARSSPPVLRHAPTGRREDARQTRDARTAAKEDRPGAEGEP
jgi:hypothetical protein